MISIRAEVDELERFHQLRRQATDCYALAIRNTAEYAVEFESDVTGLYRKHLMALAGEVDRGGLAVMEDSRATLRNLLRDYRDKGSQYLGGMREELAGTTRALEEIMESLARTDGEAGDRIRESLGQLRDGARVPDIHALRNLVMAATEAIESNVEELRNQHLLTISQFQTEIRVLHRRIDALERAASIGSLTDLLPRGEIEARVAQGLAGCCVLTIKAGGLLVAASQYDPAVAEELSGALIKRLRNGMPPGSELGQWSEDGFVAIVRVPKADAVKTAKWIAEHLSGAYSCLLDGKTVRPSLQVSVAVVDAGTMPPRQVLERARDFLI